MQPLAAPHAALASSPQMRIADRGSSGLRLEGKWLQ
jgi:hypothetical protein